MSKLGVPILADRVVGLIHALGAGFADAFAIDKAQAVARMQCRGADAGWHAQHADWKGEGTWVPFSPSCPPELVGEYLAAFCHTGEFALGEESARESQGLLWYPLVNRLPAIDVRKLPFHVPLSCRAAESAAA